MTQKKNRGAKRRTNRPTGHPTPAAIPARAPTRSVEKIVYEAFRFVMDMLVATVILWCFIGLEALTHVLTEWAVTVNQDGAFALTMHIAHYALLGIGELLYIVLLVSSAIRSIKEIRP